MFGRVNNSPYLCPYIIVLLIIQMEIKKTLQAHGFTIQAAADAMGVDRVTLSRTIARNPTVNTLRRLSEAVGIPLWQFFADELPAAPAHGAVCPRCGCPLMICAAADDSSSPAPASVEEEPPQR